MKAVRRVGLRFVCTSLRFSFEGKVMSFRQYGQFLMFRRMLHYLISPEMSAHSGRQIVFLLTDASLVLRYSPCSSTVDVMVFLCGTKEL